MKDQKPSPPKQETKDGIMTGPTEISDKTKTTNIAREANADPEALPPEDQSLANWRLTLAASPDMSQATADPLLDEDGVFGPEEPKPSKDA